MLLHGFVMPALKQSIVSIKFMTSVRNGDVFMPKAQDIDVCKAVPYPPTNDMLVDLIDDAVDRQVGHDGWTEETLQPVRALMEIVRKKGADKAWLLKMLWCFDRGSAVFDKSYRYVRPKNKLNPERIEVFGNDDGFFNDLPRLQPHEMRGRQMRMSKADKQLLQMRVYEERQANLKRRMDSLRRQMNQA